MKYLDINKTGILHMQKNSLKVWNNKNKLAHNRCKHIHCFTDQEWVKMTSRIFASSHLPVMLRNTIDYLASLSLGLSSLCVASRGLPTLASRVLGSMWANSTVPHLNKKLGLFYPFLFHALFFPACNRQQNRFIGIWLALE